MQFLNKSKHQWVSVLSEKIVRGLLAPVSIMPLAFFRIMYGAVLIWFAVRYFYYGYIFRDYIEPKLLFPMVSWVPRLPGVWMYLPFVGLLLGAVGIFLGWRFRFNAWLFFVSWLYVFVIDVSSYNNHYYLVLLLAILLGVTDSHRWLSLDVRRVPSLKLVTLPYWQLFLFQFQVFVLYFYGGLSKVHPKWLDGTIMTSLVSGLESHDIFWVLTLPVAVFLWTYLGLFFDLFVGFFLFWKPTRKWAVVSCIGFHLFNEWILFSPHATHSPIGVFPMIGMVLCLVFVERSMWMSFLLRLRKYLALLLRQMGTDSVALDTPFARDASVSDRLRGKWDSWILVFVGLYMVIQIGLPLRKYVFPDYLWTREGILFGWTMKLSTYGDRDFIRFRVKDAFSGLSWEVDLRDHLTYFQYRKMCASPYMAWMYAQYLSDLYAQNKSLQDVWKRRQKKGLPDPQVYVTLSGVSLHAFTTRPLFSPEVDLAHETYSYWKHNDWILLRE